MQPWTKNQNSRPGFIADHASVTRGSGRQIDWSRVPDSFKAGKRYTITTSAQANASATSISVTALPVALPVGTILQFGADEFAQLTAPAAVGATSLTVAALAEQIEGGDTATYLVSQSGKKVIPAGTIMAVLSSGKMIPRSAVTGSETAACLLASNAEEDAGHNALSGFGDILGCVVYENLLPDYGAGSLSTWKTELQAAGVGTGFAWQTYADSRAT